MRNLLRMHRHGLPCPTPLEQKEHVLVMSFLGTQDGWPAPQLREVTHPPTHPPTHQVNHLPTYPSNKSLIDPTTHPPTSFLFRSP